MCCLSLSVVLGSGFLLTVHCKLLGKKHLVNDKYLKLVMDTIVISQFQPPLDTASQSCCSSQFECFIDLVTFCIFTNQIATQICFLSPALTSMNPKSTSFPISHAGPKTYLILVTSEAGFVQQGKCSCMCTF